VKHLTDEDDDHGEEEHDKKRDQLPRVTGRDVTHSLHSRTAYVTRIRADVTNYTAAVAVFLHNDNKAVVDIRLRPRG